MAADIIFFFSDTQSILVRRANGMPCQAVAIRLVRNAGTIGFALPCDLVGLCRRSCRHGVRACWHAYLRRPVSDSTPCGFGHIFYSGGKPVFAGHFSQCALREAGVGAVIHALYPISCLGVVAESSVRRAARLALLIWASSSRWRLIPCLPGKGSWGDPLPHHGRSRPSYRYPRQSKRTYSIWVSSHSAMAVAA